MSDDLFTAVGNFGFERGRVNVVLNDAGPVQGMAANRQFIADRRAEGDAALHRAMAQLEGNPSPEIQVQAFAVKKSRERIADLRKRTGRDLVLLKDQREQGLAGEWFAAMTQYIEAIEGLLVSISRDISNADGVISRYSSLKHETLALRNTAGPEMSILSATMRSERPITPQLSDKIGSLHIITGFHFDRISELTQGFQSDVIPRALERLKRVYFSEYIPYRDELIPYATTGGPYPFTQKAFLAHGVKALKEIAQFMDVIVSETKAHAAERLDRSRRQIMLYSFSAAMSLVGVILIIAYLNLKVIAPIRQLTTAVRKLAGKDLHVDVPMLNAENEIGDMARAIDVFKGMAVQLEKDNDLLVEAEEKIRKSEAQLRTILDSLLDMVIEIDDKMTVRWANKAALDENPSAVGRPCYEAFPGKDHVCEGCYCALALESGKIETGIMHQPASKTAGESYWENIGIPIESPDDGAVRLLEVSRNVTQRVKAETEREKLIDELRTALSEVKTLSGLLPICAHCKKIRNDEGYWDRIESYIQKHSEAQFSHSICQECAKKFYPDFDIYEA